MSYSTDSTVMSLKDLHLEGNIIPMEWFSHITFDNGKPDTNAILILSDVVYWYRPTVVRDERTGRVVDYRKKFKADLLQKNYQDYENLFGLSKKQIRDAFVRLEEMGLIRRVLRTVETSFGVQGNVMFIELFPDEVRRITHKSPPPDIEIGSSLHQSKEVLTSMSPPLDIEGKTYTKITPEIIPKTHAKERVQENVSQKMLDMWNEALKPSCPTQRTSFRDLRLQEILETYFQDNLSHWKSFCEEVTFSSFLMGQGERKWRVTLDWILDSRNLQKVLEGNYKDAPDSLSQEEDRLEDAAQKAQAHLQQISNPMLYGFFQSIINSLGAPCALSWFKEVQLEQEGARLTLLCPTPFIRDFIQRNFDQSVFSVGKILFPDLERITYKVTLPSTPSSSTSSPSEFPSFCSPQEGGRGELPAEAHPSSLKEPECCPEDETSLHSPERARKSSPKLYHKGILYDS